MWDKKLKLADGNLIPQLGMGVAFMDDTNTIPLVHEGLAAGYRLFDGAAFYRNEAKLGEALDLAMNAGTVARDEIFVTTKVWPSMLGYDKVMESFDASYEKLGLEKIDLFLLHWPAPAKDLYVESWRALIELQKQGRVTSIGVSNFFPDQLNRLKDETGVMPVINQIEMHPLYQRAEERAFHVANNIITQCWSPLGRGNCLDNAQIGAIAQRHNVVPAQVILRWLLDQDLAIIPRSLTPSRLHQNIDLDDISLSKEDCVILAGLDIGLAGKIQPDPEESA